MLKKEHIFLFISLFFVGVIWAAWRHQFFYLILPTVFKSKTDQLLLKKRVSQQKKVLFYLPTHDAKKPFVAHQLMVSSDGKSIEKNMKHVIEKWLFLQQEADLIKKKVLCQGICFDQKTAILVISFSDAFLQKKWPLYFSWNLLKGLMQTMFNQFPQIQKVSFLINYEVWEYPYFDFSQPLSRTLF